MKKLSIYFMLALSVALILVTSLDGTIAYFTTYATAKGGHTISASNGDTDVEEGFSNWTKRLTVSNSEQGQPIYVRAKAFSGDIYTLEYSGDGWTAGSDGYYYYDEILYGGEKTTELLIRISGIPEDTVEGDSFNVIVVYESALMQYDESGRPYADWNDGGARS